MYFTLFSLFVVVVVYFEFGRWDGEGTLSESNFGSLEAPTKSAVNPGQSILE